ASVTVDGAAVGGTIDLYSPTQQWQVPITFGGLSSGTHTLQVTILSTANPSSTGRVVVIDGFSGPITPIGRLFGAPEPMQASELNSQAQYSIWIERWQVAAL
ncbi:MAG: hypothetical protein ACM3JD_14355, partial [Rudaea sp.]